MPILWNKTRVFLYHLVNRPILKASEKVYNVIFLISHILLGFIDLRCTHLAYNLLSVSKLWHHFHGQWTLRHEITFLRHYHLSVSCKMWRMRIWRTWDIQYDSTNTIRTDESFANVVTVEFGYCRSHLKTAVRCGVQWKCFFRALASGFHYSEGRVSLVYALHCYKLSTFCEIWALNKTYVE